MGGFLDSRGSSAECALWMPETLRKYVQAEEKAEKTLLIDDRQYIE